MKDYSQKIKILARDETPRRTQQTEKCSFCLKNNIPLKIIKHFHHKSCSLFSCECCNILKESFGQKHQSFDQFILAKVFLIKFQKVFFRKKKRQIRRSTYDSC